MIAMTNVDYELTYFWPVFPFYTLWGYKMGTLARYG